MFCPSCRDEFRAGFTRCARCNVDLVEDLRAHERREARGESQRERSPLLPMADYCGFFDLEEAREARERLRPEGIRCEIAIRELPGETSGAAVEEEYWLRVETSRFRQAAALLGYDAADESPGGEKMACGACGTQVAVEESFCPNCGAKFEA